MPYHYRDGILTLLLSHGLRPTPDTPPQRLRDAVNDLYRFELRTLRNRYRRREIPKDGYTGRVIELRQRYRLLSIPIPLWTK